jgi:hypothetical protein
VRGIKRNEEKNNKRTVGVNSPHWNKETDKKTKLSERIAGYVIGGYLKNRFRIWMFRKEFKESKLHLKSLYRICLDHTSPVTSPLALISQIQGSGGALLSQLFDGHPEIHAHPHELMIGYPKKHLWPRIDLNDRPEHWFEILFEDIVVQYVREGYSEGKNHDETFPFIFLPSLQRKIFLKYIDSAPTITRRDVFNAYMTSYFGAWLSNQNYNGQKRFVTAFTSSLAMLKENMELFFEIYPDGRLISLVRDPKNWFPSARKRWPERCGDVGRAVSEWKESVQTMLWNKETYGDRVCLIKFEDLLSKTNAIMHYLAGFLGIEFDDILLVPTFNKLPGSAKARLKEEKHDTQNRPPLSARKLTEQELNTIERDTSETYTLVLKEVVTFE